MPYYAQVSADGETQAHWRIDGSTAVRLGIVHPERAPGCYFAAQGGETVWEVMRRDATAWFEAGREHRFFRPHLGPGEYHPRFCRPGSLERDAATISPFSRTDKDTVAISRGQLETLVGHLSQIFRTVHPVSANFSAFGHEIRNLLILCCTEVESQWRGILAANGYFRSRYSTNDYVRLAGPMRLGEYSVAFGAYPWLSDVRPFAGWGASGKPSQELPWYQAYNLAKHDREGQFESASLGHCVSAVAAYVVMMCAQFGAHEALGFGELRRTVHPQDLPVWHPSELYLSPAYPADNWIARDFPFESPPTLDCGEPR